MKRLLAFSLFLFAVTASAQYDIREGVRTTTLGTVADVDDARRQVQLIIDNEQTDRIVVMTDSVSTEYHGFGGLINGQPEIFRGSTGFGNLRGGDRIEVRGVGRSSNSIMAERITLRGRAIAAPATGVGTTRSGGSVSTPSASTTGGVSTDSLGRVEGVVRQLNVADNRIVIETDRREMINVRTTASTPVYYRGDVYQIRNLDVGDRIRIEPDTTLATGEIRARVIDVIRSVQEGASGTTGSTARATSLEGRVTRVDRAADMALVQTDRGEIRVDLARAADPSGRRVRASDLQVNDRVQITGTYATNDNTTFVATTVRFSDDVFAPAPGTTPSGGSVDVRATDLVSVTIYGTVTESLATAPQLAIRDSQGRTTRISITDDFVVRTRAGGYTTADRLKEGEAVTVKAFRDSDNNYIAQTVRQR